MAKISNLNLPTLPEKFEDLNEVMNYLYDLIKAASETFDSIIDEMNGKIEIVNLYVTEVTVADTGVADTDFTVTHNLGRTPKFYIPRITSSLGGAASFYDGSVAWNSTAITLKCTAANLAVNFLVLA